MNTCTPPESCIENDGKVSCYAIYAMFLLVSTFSANKLNRFLLATVSQPLARDIHFGDKGCVPVKATFSGDYKEFCMRSLNDELELNQTA